MAARWSHKPKGSGSSPLPAPTSEVPLVEEAALQAACGEFNPLSEDHFAAQAVLLVVECFSLWADSCWLA